MMDHYKNGTENDSVFSVQENSSVHDASAHEVKDEAIGVIFISAYTLWRESEVRSAEDSLLIKMNIAI